MPCTLNANGGTAPIRFNANYWWNGGQALPVASLLTVQREPGLALPGSSAPVVGSSGREQHRA
ncbi:MAG: hypothetical protein U1E77_18795 [Inhella sp.]